MKCVGESKLAPHTIVQPIQPIHITWSSLALPISLQENVELNHFVPLLPMSSVDQSEGFLEVRGSKKAKVVRNPA